MNLVIEENWGIISYDAAWDKQKKYFDEVIDAKLNNSSYTNRIIICEHPSVYTLGKSGVKENMLLSELQLKQLGAELYHIDRGGDITYHGPGQIVCYPIIDLDAFNLGLKAYIHLLEEAVIKVCAHYKIEAERLEGATGVWLDSGTSKERKICAMGVRSSHFITMHGLALNVNTDLNYFNYINPCGFCDKGVTSFQKESGQEVSETLVADLLVQKINELLQER